MGIRLCSHYGCWDDERSTNRRTQPSQGTCDKCNREICIHHTRSHKDLPGKLLCIGCLNSLEKALAGNSVTWFQTKVSESL